MDERRQKQQAWRDLSRRVRWHFGSWLGGFLTLAVAAFLLEPGKLNDAVMPGLFVVWSLAMIGTGLHLHHFRCPYCGSRFLGHFWVAPQRCQHCAVIRGG